MGSSTRAGRVDGLVIGFAIAAVLGVTVAGIGIGALEERSLQSGAVAIAVSVDPTSDRITVLHRGGSSIDVRRIDLVVTIDGQRLEHQPPIPFFAAKGFHGGPTGPFNVAADPLWSVGERASLRIAGTNTPQLRHGRTVVVRLRRNGTVIATGRTTIGTATRGRWHGRRSPRDSHDWPEAPDVPRRPAPHP